MTDLDLIDACDIDMAEDPTPDDDIAGVVLFADCETEAEVAIRKAEWKEIFDGP